MRAAFEDFSALLPDDRALSINDPGGDWDELSGVSAARRAVAQRLESCADDPNCSLSIRSNDANIPDYTFEYRGYALDIPDFQKWAGLVFVTLPPNELQSNAAGFRSMFIKLITGLPNFAAYSTLSLEGDQDLIQKIAKKRPGLDISSVGSIAKDIERRAPGAFWLNAYKGDLREAVLAQISGQEPPTGVQIAPVGPDIQLIMLAPEPSRLDRTAADSDAAYRWLANNLRACGRLHVPRKVTYFEDEDDVEDADAQRMWHLRFVDASR